MIGKDLGLFSEIEKADEFLLIITKKQWWII